MRTLEALTAAVADRYRIERELGADSRFADILKPRNLPPRDGIQ